MTDSGKWWWWSNGMSDGLKGSVLTPLGWSVLLATVAFAFLFYLVVT